MRSALRALAATLALTTARAALAAEGPALAAGASASASPSGADADAAGATDAHNERTKVARDRRLDESSVLSGGVGLLHTQHARGGAAGQFRLGLVSELYSGGFLCTASQTCRDPRGGGGRVASESSDHFGGRLSLAVDVLRWLEVYGGTSAQATSSNQNRPQLIQALGDVDLGAKAHFAATRVLSLGVATEAWLLSGTGGVGVDGSSTSMKFRGLATLDLRDAAKPIPLRASFNTTYSLDNSGELARATEASRGEPITRIERYGLGVNRVDHVDFHLGVEGFVAKERVRPFVEYRVLVPMNRQGYLCQPANPSADRCLANDAFAPSSLTLGSRFLPWRHGFALTAAVDVGVTGTATFLEEMAPIPPWMLYLGAGWAFDTVEPPPRHSAVAAPVVAEARRAVIDGRVTVTGSEAPVADAIVSFSATPTETALATAADGRFRTRPLDAGRYELAVRAAGYEPAACVAIIPEPPTGPVAVRCEMRALPTDGALDGRVVDAAGSPVAAAKVRVVAANGSEQSLSSAGDGAFVIEKLAAGRHQVLVEADGYLSFAVVTELSPRQRASLTVTLQSRPKQAMVTVGKTEIAIRQQIQFGVDSAGILPESTALLTEIAEVFQRNPRLKRVEVQGHTDNSGTPDHNQDLSDQRAKAVAAWLTAHGVAADRLVPKGYGQSRPRVPNVTPGNRAKNRRVQLVILEQDPASP